MKLYVIYEIGTNKNICYTNEINHAMELVKAFNESDEITKHSIKIIEK